MNFNMIYSKIVNSKYIPFLDKVEEMGDELKAEAKKGEIKLRGK